MLNKKNLNLNQENDIEKQNQQGQNNDQPKIGQKEQDAQVQQKPTTIIRPSNFFSELVELKRSGYISDFDLTTELDKISKQIEISCCLGSTPIDMHIFKNKYKFFDRKIANDQGNYQIYQRKEDSQQKYLKRETINNNLSKDGIFIEEMENNAQILERNRFEQRMLWDQSGSNDSYFNDNGDFILDKEYYDNKISKVLQLSFDNNPCHQIIRRTATMCERLNQNKHIPYKLNVMIGRIQLSRHPLENQEEKDIRELKLYIKKYRARTDLALIPHSSKIIALIDKEIAELSKMIPPRDKEIQILLNEKQKQSDKRMKEVELIRTLMINISETWNRIVTRRNEPNSFWSTQYILQLKEYKNDDGGNEIELGLGKEKVEKTADDKTNVPAAELTRRQNVRGQKIYVQVYINNKYVARTRSVSITWPGYICEFMEKFQILLFTKPKNIKLRILLDTTFSKSLDFVDLEVPGEQSYSITSSNIIKNQVEFSEGADIRKQKLLEEEEKNQIKLQQIQKKKGEEIESLKKQIEDKRKQEFLSGQEFGGQKNISLPQEEQGKPVQTIEEMESLLKQKEEAKEKEFQDNQQERIQQVKKEEKSFKDQSRFEGKISYMIEWETNTESTTQMPPEVMENLNAQNNKQQTKEILELLQTQSKNDDDYEETQFEINRLKEQGFHFDINDPKFQLLVKKIKLYQIKNLLDNYHKGFMMPFYDIMSLRQRIIRIRQDTYPEIEQIPISEVDFRDGDVVVTDVAGNNQLRKYLDIIKEVDFSDEQDVVQMNKTKKKEVLQRDDLNMDEQEFFAAQDPETKDRIKNILKILTFRQRQIRQKQNTIEGEGPMSLKSVVKEFYFEDTEVLIYELIKSIFTQKRKLGAKKIKTDKVIYTSKKDVTINIYVSHGNNVPSRFSSKWRVEQYKKMMIEAPRQLNTQPNMQQALIDQNQQKQINGQQQNQELVTPKAVNSFVQVNLQSRTQEDIISSSKCSDGKHPDWNSDISLKFSSKNKDSYFTLSEIKDPNNKLYISLFDEFEKRYDIYHQGVKYEITKEHYFLGSVIIPLNQIMQSPKQQSQFKIDRPLVIFGYYIEPNVIGGTNERQPEEDITIVNPRISTYVTLAINTEPELDLPQDNESEFHGNQEDQGLLLMGQKFLSNLKKDKLLSQRYIALWGEDIKNNSYLLPRFLVEGGVKPPFDDGNINTDSIEKVARFVSLIPSKDTSDTFEYLPNSILTNQQFLDIKGGDSCEHAIMLCNYFMYIDQITNKKVKDYVVLGNAVPEGKVFYVVRMDADPVSAENRNKVEIWNPLTGEPFLMSSQIIKNMFLCWQCGSTKTTIVEEHDQACPLYSVGCVFDHQNVYVNKQKFSGPEQIEWDISNKNNWVPFLDESKVAKFFKAGRVQTIQEKDIRYEDIPVQLIEALELNIQSYLMRKIEDSRNKMIPPQNTIFCHQVCKQIRDSFLPYLEVIKYSCRLSGMSSSLDEKKRKELEQIQQLEDLCRKIKKKIEDRDKKFYGFPLNLTFTDYQTIWDCVEATGIQQFYDKEAEFILSVQCYQYKNFIISVWVFLGILLPQDN